LLRLFEGRGLRSRPLGRGLLSERPGLLGYRSALGRRDQRRGLNRGASSGLVRYRDRRFVELRVARGLQRSSGAEQRGSADDRPHVPSQSRAPLQRQRGALAPSSLIAGIWLLVVGAPVCVDC
jgi:hypothetical protein